MKIRENNFAYIDGQNFYLGVKELGWLLDYKRFLVYLREKYAVSKAYIFIGYIAENQQLYKFLQECGYILIFKPILIPPGEKKPKGNVDADLILRAIIDFPDYDKPLLPLVMGTFTL